MRRHLDKTAHQVAADGAGSFFRAAVGARRLHNLHPCIRNVLELGNLALFPVIALFAVLEFKALEMAGRQALCPPAAVYMVACQRCAGRQHTRQHQACGSPNLPFHCCFLRSTRSAFMTIVAFTSDFTIFFLFSQQFRHVLRRLARLVCIRNSAQGNPLPACACV